jgi:protein O-mannosyl-transferase
VGQNDFSVLDKRPAKAATALPSSPQPGSSPGEPPTVALPERAFWILGAVVALVTLAVFLPSVRNSWVNWDDADNFLGNPHFRGLGWSNIRWVFSGSVQDAHWIPLTWLTLSLDYVIWGMNPAGYHLTSLLIHSVNALLCYVLAYRLLELGFGAGARPRDLRLAAAVAALFFALHPLRVESVAWITERRDVLMGLFAFSTVLAWLEACRAGTPGRPARRWYWTAVGCFAAALLSKAMVVGLPIVLVVLDVYPLRRVRAGGGRWPTRLVRLAILEKAPFLLLSSAAGAVTLVIAAQRTHATPLSVLGMVPRLAVSAYGLAFYLRKTLVPWPLSPLYTLFHPVVPWRATYVGPALIVIGISALTVAARRRWPAGLAVWISYVALLLPMLGLLHNGTQITADRFTYAAAVGPAILVGAAVAWCRQASLDGRIAPALGSGVLTATLLWIVVLTALTVPQIGIWKDSVTLWTRAAEAEPQSDIPIFYLGWALTEAGRFDEARGHFQRSLARVPPEFPTLRAQFLFHVGMVELRGGRPADAEARFREALRLDPEHPAAWIRLGVVLWARGQREEATRAWAKAVSLAPRWGAYQLWEIRLAASEMPEVAAVARGRLAFNLGALLEHYRQPGQALEQYRVAAALLPDDMTACGRAKRLSAAMAPGETVACDFRGRP